MLKKSGKQNKKLQTTNYKLQTHSGFTLVELIITLAIIVFISGAVVLGLSGQRGSQNLKLTLNELISVTRDTQNKSITQESGKQWGIRFSNSTSTQKYEIFSGPSYASGTVSKAYSLSRGIKFSEPSASSTYDLIFSAISGQLSGNKIISLVTGRKDSFVGDIIFNTFGLTTSRFENNVAGYWHFDEGTASSSYDSSGNSNTGTLTNGPTWQSGSSCKAGGCISFDGTNDNVVVPNSSSMQIAGDLTIVFWIYPNILSGRQSLIGKNINNEFGLVFESNGLISLYQGDGGWEEIAEPAGFTAPAGTWTHMVLTRTVGNKSIYFYKNGILVGNDSYAKTVVVSNSPVYLGGWVSGYTFFNGLLDEVRVYNRALSATEILNHYNDLK